MSQLWVMGWFHLVFSWGHVIILCLVFDWRTLNNGLRLSHMRPTCWYFSLFFYLSSPSLAPCQPVRLGLKRSNTIVDYYCWLVWCEKNTVLAENLRSFTTKWIGRVPLAAGLGLWPRAASPESRAEVPFVVGPWSHAPPPPSDLGLARLHPLPLTSPSSTDELGHALLLFSPPPPVSHPKVIFWVVNNLH